MNSKRSWVICCFLNFIVASIMGLMIRFAYLFPFKSINYIYLLHAHSHVAMLGWVYIVIYVLTVHFFIPKDKSDKPIYNQLFWITEFTVLGMMISFPIQGYALFSIVFSTLHILLSYVFCWLVWRDHSKDKKGVEKLLIASILFMVFSTFGVWCLGPTINMLGKQSVFYQIAIQFFLHFQFNGWFLFAVLALFLKQFKNGIETKQFKTFLIGLIVATFFTVAFPISWYLKSSILKWVTILGVLSQLIAFIYFYKILKPQIKVFKANLDSITKKAYGLALCSLSLKIIVQLIVVLPNLADISHQIRSWVIGFIHLTTLGIITGFLFGILLQNNLLPRKAYLLKIGVKCFFFGYVITEILLFMQGIFYYSGKGLLFGYYEAIFGASIFIVAGLLSIMISVLKTKIRFD
ncbi:hypothetical protein [Flavobacterium sp. MDT1-60]|uniref:hypothetical protein n=1 Tax=Flavobacterium sp. MDT1-60 TaxID=1979344 RepID=UPI001782C815|nr:hypothetical protein [Flavobacterium sp. MDT1-60]QOG01796.1 hypothetical protein IHE43_18635 [Flavobacterium sp. MDT1-60]